MTKNIAASVRHKLLNKSKTNNRPFNETLQYFAMERFLYRLSKSKHAKKFILKGALLLQVWQSSQYRPTMDIDILSKTSNKVDSIVQQLNDIIDTEVEPDGLEFSKQSITAEKITEDADYQGIRVSFEGALGNARIHMQIDIGFGDKVHPEPSKSNMPTILELPEPNILCYSKESAIAEKLEAMVKLGEINSRMKDFYDIWLLSRQFDFKGSDLAQAINLTFTQRKTLIPESIEHFTGEFSNNKQTLWRAFRNRLKQEFIPEKFADITNHNHSFLSPIIKSINDTKPFTAIWVAPNKWVYK